MHYGINGNIWNWVRDFLTGRTQRVVVNGNPSSWLSVTSGIPQGSVLGLILFVIYVNDHPQNISSEVFMFADDTKVYRSIVPLSLLKASLAYITCLHNPNFSDSVQV